jgi:hypothetical protein
MTVASPGGTVQAPPDTELAVSTAQLYALYVIFSYLYMWAQ